MKEYYKITSYKLKILWKILFNILGYSFIVSLK
jgi:hypothetical protein